MKRKSLAFLFLCAFCVAISLGQKLTSTSPIVEGKAWVGVTYAMAKSKKGYSAEEVAAVGAFGALHATMEGAIWGFAVGGPAGFIAGAVAGL